MTLLLTTHKSTNGKPEDTELQIKARNCIYAYVRSTSDWIGKTNGRHGSSLVRRRSNLGVVSHNILRGIIIPRRRRNRTYVPGYWNLHVKTEPKTHSFCVGNPSYFKQQHTATQHTDTTTTHEKVAVLQPNEAETPHGACRHRHVRSHALVLSRFLVILAARWRGVRRD